MPIRQLCAASCLLMVLLFSALHTLHSAPPEKYKVLAFYTAKNDAAHISFVHEANLWFANVGPQNNFTYETTNDWDKLNDQNIKNYDLLIFLDTRPESSSQRNAFQAYMEQGGAWMGFHFSAFSLDQSAFPDNWNWYHHLFLGSGQYKSNTWRPTSAVLRIVEPNHPVVNSIGNTFVASPNEWYCWENDLRLNPDIDIIAAVDTTSFPLGTGPKQHEIWHSGFYPVVWSNKNFKMMYFNMGHNDIDYEGKTNRELSQTFENEKQNKLILNSILWLVQKQ